MISYSLINHDVAIKLIIPKRMYIHIQNCLCMCIEISPAEWRTSKNGFWFSCHDILTWFYSCVDIFSISITSLLYLSRIIQILIFDNFYILYFIYYEHCSISNTADILNWVWGTSLCVFVYFNLFICNPWIS